nr:phBC6A51 family helix-turn-helix protein [Pseudoxanthomonas sp.]
MKKKQSVPASQLPSKLGNVDKKSNGAPSATSEPDCKKLTPKQVRAIELIIAGESLQAVAKDVGVCRQTLSEWKNRDTEFSRVLNQLLTDAEESLRFTLPAIHLRMLSKLEKIADEAPYNVRLDAIRLYIDRFLPADRDDASQDLPEPDAAMLQAMVARRKREGSQ